MFKVDAKKDERLLGDLANIIKKVRGDFISRFGAEADKIIQESRMEYKEIIPHIPSARNQEPFTRFLVSAGQYLALYRVLRKHGMSTPEIGEFIYSITESLFDLYPGFLLRFLSPNIFSSEYMEKIKRGAYESQMNPFGGYVFRFIDGTSEFNYGVDYTECGVINFLSDIGASELTPYIRATDTLYSERLGWGLKRTATLAEGGGVCDFRFRKGKTTNVVSGVIRKKNWMG